MKTPKTLMMAAALALTLPLTAQDFGYPNDKAFYKAHWNEVLKDLGPDVYLNNAQYVLFDFDKDNTAELYLWVSKHNEYLYTIRENKVVRVSETASTVEDAFWLGDFYAHFMAPYQLLLDQSIEPFEPMEQQFYDMYEVPRIWFGLHPKMEGVFTIKKAIAAINTYDCETLTDCLTALESGEYSQDEVEEFVMDPRNGYASIQLKSKYMNKVELCYWNITNGEKLLAMHFHLSNAWGEGNVDWFEQILFMKYDPKTKSLNPVVAPIEGFDFKTDCNFSLPRRGTSIHLIAADEQELKWTGSSFK